jgi:hypothetical protein
MRLYNSSLNIAVSASISGVNVDLSSINSPAVNQSSSQIFLSRETCEGNTSISF